MARFVPPHPKKGSPEAYAWAKRMQALRGKRGRRARNPRAQPTRLQWDVYAGGTGAAPGTNSYKAQTTIGDYFIDPFTTRTGRPAGYLVKFANTKGVIAQSGLWRDLGQVRSPQAGKKLAWQHYVGLIPHANPGAVWHAQKRREANTMDRAARTRWQKDFFHGKSVAHLESTLAARAAGWNPLTRQKITQATAKVILKGTGKQLPRKGRAVVATEPLAYGGRTFGVHNIDGQFYAIEYPQTNPHRTRSSKMNPRGYRYTGTLKFPTYVHSAITRVLNEGPRGIEWVFSRQMTQANRDHFDKWLVSIQHPLAYEAGTQEQRFKRFMRDHVMPYIVPDNPRRARSRPARSRPAQPTRNPLAIYGLGNPNGRISAKVEGVVYNRVLEIKAEKTGTFKPGLYRHPFGARSKVVMLALDNGDLLVHSTAGTRLWGPT